MKCPAIHPSESEGWIAESEWLFLNNSLFSLERTLDQILPVATLGILDNLIQANYEQRTSGRALRATLRDLTEFNFFNSGIHFYTFKNINLCY